MPNPFFITSDINPNEVFGVCACSFAGQQKSVDCGGQWNTWHTVPVGRPAPRLTVCDNHLLAAAATRAPGRTRNKRTRTKLDEVPSL